MALSLGMITIDTTDAGRLARWWALQTGAQVVHDFDGAFVVIAGGGLPSMLAFQQVADPTPGKNKIHLDLTARDPEAEVERLLGEGATVVGRRGDAGFSWVTLADPDGNEFCVAGREETDALA